MVEVKEVEEVEEVKEIDNQNISSKPGESGTILITEDQPVEVKEIQEDNDFKYNMDKIDMEFNEDTSINNNLDSLKTTTISDLKTT